MSDDRSDTGENSSHPQTYNGWSNYETWCVALWLSNDQGIDSYIRELVHEAKDRYAASQAIKEYIDEHNPVADQATVFADLMNAALSEVDWIEVADSFLEE